MSSFRTFPVMLLFLFLWTACFAQEGTRTIPEPWDEITRAFEKGDAGSLAGFFTTIIDIGLPEKNDAYSKSQGEIVMKDFFKRFPPDTFEISQKGMTSETSRHAICQYHSGKDAYQVTIYLQKDKEAFLINRIKFEKK